MTAEPSVPEGTTPRTEAGKRMVAATRTLEREAALAWLTPERLADIREHLGHTNVCYSTLRGECTCGLAQLRAALRGAE